MARNGIYDKTDSGFQRWMTATHTPKVMRWECSCGTGGDSKQPPEVCPSCKRTGTITQPADHGRLLTEEEQELRAKQSEEFWASLS